MMKFQPEYLVGFPSTMLDIAQHGLMNNYNFPAGVVKAIFPTAETVTKEMRITIETFFKAKIYDQYASSEGAPFIFEYININLHLELLMYIYEDFDDYDNTSIT